jgi:hypothetical protein
MPVWSSESFKEPSAIRANLNYSQIVFRVSKLRRFGNSLPKYPHRSYNLGTLHLRYAKYCFAETVKWL